MACCGTAGRRGSRLLKAAGEAVRGGQTSPGGSEGCSQGHPACLRSEEERASLPCLLSSDAS